MKKVIMDCNTRASSFGGLDRVETETVKQNARKMGSVKHASSYLPLS